VVGSPSSRATNRQRQSALARHARLGPDRLIRPTHWLLLGTVWAPRTGPTPIWADSDRQPRAKRGLPLARPPSAPALRPSFVAPSWATAGRRSPATTSAGGRLATRPDPAGPASCRDRFPRQPPPQPHRRHARRRQPRAEGAGGRQRARPPPGAAAPRCARSEAQVRGVSPPVARATGGDTPLIR